LGYTDDGKNALLEQLPMANMLAEDRVFAFQELQEIRAIPTTPIGKECGFASGDIFTINHKGTTLDVQRNTLDCGKHKALTYEDSDVFEAYSQLCATNMKPRCSSDLPQAVGVHASSVGNTHPLHNEAANASFLHARGHWIPHNYVLHSTPVDFEFLNLVLLMSELHLQPLLPRHWDIGRIKS
ncbi:hypothetical protein Tco_1047181, partial [Tanacetum coccineum]